MMIRAFRFCLVLVWCLGGVLNAWAWDETRCEAANTKASSTYSTYQTARAAHDYCTRYGDTSGTGYGSRDCNAAYSRMQEAKSDYDNAVSEQWQYCY